MTLLDALWRRRSLLIALVVALVTLIVAGIAISTSRVYEARRAEVDNVKARVSANTQRAQDAERQRIALCEAINQGRRDANVPIEVLRELVDISTQPYERPRNLDPELQRLLDESESRVAKLKEAAKNLRPLPSIDCHAKV